MVEEEAEDEAKDMVLKEKEEQSRKMKVEAIAEAPTTIKESKSKR